MANVTAQEQLMLELINRGRMDPVGEAARMGVTLNQGLNPGTISTAPKPILAMNDALAAAADNHSAWMVNNNAFDHVEFYPSPGFTGTQPRDRMAFAGYSFFGSNGSGENIARRGSTGPIEATSTIVAQYSDLFLSPGHRTNMLRADYKEIGVGQQFGPYTSGGTTYNGSLVTQTFAYSGAATFVSGVVYNDNFNNNFYDVGEGLGGVRATAQGAFDDSSNAGGYELGLSNGNTNFSIGGVQLNFTLNGQGIKVDLVNGTEIWTNTSVSIASGATAVHALGISDLSINGSSASETIVGNAGLNYIRGGLGNDVLYGNGGNDTLLGSQGNDTLDGGQGADSMTGGQGDDIYFVDNGGDAIVEMADGGFDAAFSLTDIYMPANLENLVLWGAGSIFGVGNNLANGITGNDQRNLLFGNDGDDFIVGGLGDDELTGGSGRDTLRAGQGSDLVIGGWHSDTLTGGAGADTFIYNAREDSGEGVAWRDVITDFAIGQDKIGLSNVDANIANGGGSDETFTWIGTSGFTGFATQLRYVQQAGRTIVEGDTNGDGVADFQIDLAGTHALTASDFYL